MAVFRACFVFEKKEPEKVVFKFSQRETIILKCEKMFLETQPLKLTVLH